MMLPRENLSQNSGQFFFGMFAQQNPMAFIAFNRLLNSHNFDTIIEIGSHDFGLSVFFALYALQSKNQAVSENPNEPLLFKNRTHHKRPKQFITYDIVVHDQVSAAILKHLGGTFIQADTLNDERTIADIRSIISSPQFGRVLLLCDGGCKKKELELYGGSLKSGDFVMLHDWAEDKEAFEQNKENGIWYNWETRWENGPDPKHDQFGIKEACEKYKIYQTYQYDFDGVAWFCGEKV